MSPTVLNGEVKSENVKTYVLKKKYVTLKYEFYLKKNKVWNIFKAKYLFRTILK